MGSSEREKPCAVNVQHFSLGCHRPSLAVARRWRAQCTEGQGYMAVLCLHQGIQVVLQLGDEVAPQLGRQPLIGAVAQGAEGPLMVEDGIRTGRWGSGDRQRGLIHGIKERGAETRHNPCGLEGIGRRADGLNRSFICSVWAGAGVLHAWSGVRPTSAQTASRGFSLRVRARPPSVRHLKGKLTPHLPLLACAYARPRRASCADR